MTIVEFNVQFQCKLEDGSIVALQVPVLRAKPDVKLEDLREAINTVGFDPLRSVAKNQPRTMGEVADYVNKIRLYTGDDE